MHEPNLRHDIITVVRASGEDANQTSIERYNQLEQLAAQEAPPHDGRTYELHRETFVADLASLSGETSAQLKHEGHDYRDARHEAELFVDQQGLERRPPYRHSVAILWLALFGAMLGESVVTSPIYAPTVGWIEALFLGAVISVGVTVPAAGIGVGIVMARHRINTFLRVSGMVIAATCVLLVAAALLVGTHFRPVLAERPTLVQHPGEFAEAIWHSLLGGPFGHIVELTNWGLLAAGAVAAFLVAKEVFNTYGYIGWRPVARREESALLAIRYTEQQSKSRADGRRRAIVRTIGQEVKEATRSQRAIKQIRSLDAVITSARTKALQRISVEATRVGRLLPPGLPTGLGIPATQFGWSPSEQDRSGFHEGTERSLLLHQRFIDAQPKAIAALTQLYAVFCASLDQAVRQAMFGGPGPAGPALGGPGERL